MKPSEFLEACAVLIDGGEDIRSARKVAPNGWVEYLSLTQPTGMEWDDALASGSWDSTRVMRFLLAADIARSDGQ